MMANDFGVASQTGADFLVGGRESLRSYPPGVSGFALAPGVPTLRESLRILERNKKLVGRQARKVVPS